MQTFAALADPVRAEIVKLLARRDLTAGDIAGRFPISRPAVSRHLSVLLKSRLVSVRGEAQRRVYSLDVRGLNEVDQWVADCRRFWGSRLDALGRRLDRAAVQSKEPDDDA
jgi:DNA-binding transcriptional ArsR family regulator